MAISLTKKTANAELFCRRLILKRLVEKEALD